MKQAALRGLIFGLIASATILAAPLCFKMGMWAHAKIDPHPVQVVQLNIR